MAQTSTLPAQVEAKPLTLRDHIANAQPEFAKTLPSYIKADRFVRTSQSALIHTRNIDKVKNPASLLAACMKAANDGLILDGREAALVVDFKGEVQYRPMMRGLLKLAHNSGQIKSLIVEKVCANDAFTYAPTADEPITHEIDLKKDRGDAYAYYALAKLMTGGIVHEVMTKAEVLAIRDRSDAWKAFQGRHIKSTPWHTDEVEMSRKTVFRRLSKYLPSSSDRDALHSAAERIDEDYSLTIDNDTTSELPTAAPTTKRRGGAAAALKDVTPAKAKPQQAKPQPQQKQPADDPDTGEVFDHDDGPDNNDPRFADDGPQPGDDI